MIGIIRLLNFALWLFKAALMAYVLLSWLHPSANKWTELLKRVLEPVLSPIRAFLAAKLPTRWQVLDWSPVAAWLLAELAARMIFSLLAIFA